MLEEVLDDERLVRRPTTAYVDLDALRHNVEYIRQRVGQNRQVMAIVKANAYGHGLIRTSKAFLDFGVDALGVAFLEEGIALRRAGVRAPILVLGGLVGNQVRHFLEHDLDLTAASPFKLRQIESVAGELGRKARVHLKFDTGMERLGVHWYSADDLLHAAAQARHIEVVGIFSHLASSEDTDRSFTELQIERFQRVLRRSLEFPFPKARAHLANSGGILFHEDSSLFDMVRPGLMLYGISPRGTCPSLRPAFRLETRVVYFKVVRAGSPLSYNGSWVAPCDTRVVTLPIGYGDGYFRALSNRAEVLIRGVRRPVVGRVTMDATMVDLGPDGTAFNGDPVVLVGSDGKGEAIHVEELATWAATIPYEILSSVSARVPRVYESPSSGSGLARGAPADSPVPDR